MAELTRSVISTLLSRLGDSQVQDDDVRDAVCSALVELGIMVKLGNLTFVFRKQESLTRTVLDMLSSPECQYVPREYYKHWS